jgi:hypothetical protein
VKAKFNNLRSWVASAEATYEKYQHPPSPIDFATPKGTIRDKELVSTLEAFYTTNQPPVKSYAMPVEELTATEERITYLKELHAVHEEFLPILEKEIDFQVNNRTTKDTTMVDMQMNYPLIHEEIEDELERREFYKDSGIGKSA